jgi:phosphatidylserine decarboxylase
VRIAQGGPQWIAWTGFVTLVCDIGAMISLGLIHIVFLIIALFGVVGLVLLVIFFRDPERKIGDGFVAAADGTVTGIDQVQDPDVGSCFWIKTFMFIQNVHVNRSPIEGTVRRVVHASGGHRPAFSKDSVLNERVTIVIESPVGPVKVVEIAGTVARRIVPYVKEGDRLKKGDRIGLIRLGSRVDVYLPVSAVDAMVVRVRDRVKAGEDTLARLHA